MKINVIENGKAITRDMTSEEEAEYIKANEPTKEQQIAELKKNLADTDYIVLKIAEAQADGDTEKVAELKTTYATELANRIVWREQINELEG